MLIKDFVAKILEEFESIPNQLPKNKEERLKLLLTLFAYRRDPITLQSAHDYLDLCDFLKQYEKSEMEATAKNLTPFVNLLSERWAELNEIPNNPHSYINASNSLATRAYVIVARNLASALSQSQEKSYNLLMPVLRQNTESTYSMKSFNFQD